jgi:putative hemolysin
MGVGMLAGILQIKENLQLRRNGIFRFRSKNSFRLEFGPYLLKTAETSDELLESFKLRNEVFNIEFRGLEKTKLDFDKFDSIFDHLLIIHLPTQKVIGTYRVHCSNQFDQSYTALEFDLENLNYYKGPYLELGRACIHKEHRRGAVISLLWRGIAEYMKMTGAQTLFGCSSLKIHDSRRAALVFKYLQEKNFVADQLCETQRNFMFEDLESWLHHFRNPLTENQIQEAQSLIPSLLNSYLKLGSKILGKPAFDRDFDCLDFLTVLNRNELSVSLDRKFSINR